MGQSCTLRFIFRIQGVNSNPFCASPQARGGGTFYNDLYDEALPESTFFTCPFSQVLQNFFVQHHNFRVNLNQIMLCAILILCNFLVLLF